MYSEMVALKMQDLENDIITDQSMTFVVSMWNAVQTVESRIFERRPCCEQTVHEE